jgi:uncharacterized protein YbbK (DUF523 family)
MYIVSACLCGINCKYNGRNNLNPAVLKLVKEGKAIPVCPEQLGGLPTPRIPSERKNGKVINKEGIDVTKNFQDGSNEVLKLCKELNIKTCILKSKSPSCGYGEIYDGNFNGTLVKGNGVLTDMLIDNGIEVISSDKIDDMI